jgi:hypothetical protein
MDESDWLDISMIRESAVKFSPQVYFMHFHSTNSFFSFSVHAFSFVFVSNSN